MHPGKHSVILGSLSLVLAVGCEPAPDEGGILQIAIPPYEVPLGAEMVRCHETALPSDRDVDIVRLTSSFSAGSHHVHVYVSADGGTDAPDRSYDCPDVVSFDDWHLLVATQAGGIDWTLPEGVAIRVKARQSLLIQTHWLNTGASGARTSVAHGGVTLGLAKPGAAVTRAAAIFGENLGIDVPPHTTGRAEGECLLRGEGDILAIMGHYHLHGRKFEAWVRPQGGEPDVVYESFAAPEPPWLAYDGLHIGKGDRLGWSCDYDNNLDIPLQTGPQASTQEHCNLFAYYTLTHGNAGFVPCVVGAK